jgi:hypothetical protein
VFHKASPTCRRLSAAWTRGQIDSNRDFTQNCLVAFGKGKRIICMDGLEIIDTLRSALQPNDVLESKMRRADKTDLPFACVRNLYPT